MPQLHEELWHYQDERVTAWVIRSPRYQEDSSGILSISPVGRLPLTRIVPLRPDSPTEEDDMEWFTIVDTTLGDL